MLVVAVVIGLNALIKMEWVKTLSEVSLTVVSRDTNSCSVATINVSHTCRLWRFLYGKTRLSRNMELPTFLLMLTLLRDMTQINSFRRDRIGMARKPGRIISFR